MDRSGGQSNKEEKRARLRKRLGDLVDAIEGTRDLGQSLAHEVGRKSDYWTIQKLSRGVQGMLSVIHGEAKTICQALDEMAKTEEPEPDRYEPYQRFPGED